MQAVKTVNASYITTMILVKISLGIFFLKIFLAHRSYQIFIYVLLALSTLSGIAYLIMNIATCGIASAFSPESCSFGSAFQYVSVIWGFLNALTDLTFSVLSVLALRNANLKRGTKWLVSGLLVFGTIGGFASIVRVLVTLGFTGTPPEVRALQIGRWSNIEAGICITAASLVTLRPLVNCCISRARSSFATATKTVSSNSRSGRPRRETEGSECIEMGLKALIVSAEEVHMTDSQEDSWRHPLQTHNLV